MDEHTGHEVRIEDHPVFSGSPGGRRSRRRRSAFSCLAAIVVLVLLLAGAVLLVMTGVGQVRDMFGGPPDYSGAGSGQVTVEVKATVLR